MPRPILLLALIVTMASTPLRLAESAGDLARTLSESGIDARVEEADGGVGDDSGESTEVDQHQVSMAIGEARRGLAGRATPVGARPSRLAARILPASVRRHVLLRCFLC